MDWLLYQRDLRQERVKSSTSHPLAKLLQLLPRSCRRIVLVLLWDFRVTLVENLKLFWMEPWF